MSNIQMQSRKELRSETHPIQAKRSKGFTLVELLVVISIIGVIAGLAIPAIGRVMRTVRKAAMQTEMSIIGQGVDAYFTKYGDYPPDFSDWNIVRRHYLKIFPDIATSELNLLFALCDTFPDGDPSTIPPTSPAPTYDPFVMDRAESIVWSLGGFSADPQFPFTGEGGPLEFLTSININGTATAGVPTLASHYQYRVTRNAPFIEFESGRLSLDVLNSTTGASFTGGVYDRTQSTDEPNGVTNLPGLYQTDDIFPSYVLREDHSPVVYFDSRSYAWNDGTTPIPVFNGFVDYEDEVDAAAISVDDLDGIRPVYSTVPRTPPAGGYASSYVASSQAFEFANPRTFQIHSPGLDGKYGVLLDSDAGTPANTAPVFFREDGTLIQLVNNGNPATVLSNVTRFDISGFVPDSTNKMRDNMANFIDGAFEDKLD